MLPESDLWSLAAGAPHLWAVRALGRPGQGRKGQLFSGKGAHAGLGEAENWLRP